MAQGPGSGQVRVPDQFDAFLDSDIGPFLSTVLIHAPVVATWFLIVRYLRTTGTSALRH